MIAAGPEGQALQLATSCYRAADLIRESRLVPVGISIGEPKFPLGYECVQMLKLAPWGLRELDDEDEFTARYRERLDAIGAKGLQKRFAEISAEHDRRGLLLLCYEKPGQF
jgi:hypothetical protein